MSSVSAVRARLRRFEFQEAFLELLGRNHARATMRLKTGEIIEEAVYYAARSKPLIDQIDDVLAQPYGLSAEELDFVVNYDLKDRLGADTDPGPER